MNKVKATGLAWTLLRKHLPAEWKFEWNKRKSALGICNFTRKTIYLSEYFLHRIPDEQIEDTILHEIAHALAYIRYGHRGHGWQWKKVCVEIGAKPVRCHDGEIQNETYRYTIKCPKCGHQHGRHRFNAKKLLQLKTGFSWFPCKCKQSRMDIYDGSKKIVDGEGCKITRKPNLVQKYQAALDNAR